jgi:hypothetical protein
VGFRDRRPEARNGGEPDVRSSVKPSNAANDNLINRTISLWQCRARRGLSAEDARQIVENVTGFFNILIEWSRAEVLRPANDNGFQLKGRSERESHFEETIGPSGQGESRP